jgi:hypothetical protein
VGRAECLNSSLPAARFFELLYAVRVVSGNQSWPEDFPRSAPDDIFRRVFVQLNFGPNGLKANPTQFWEVFGSQQQIPLRAKPGSGNC